MTDDVMTTTLYITDQAVSIRVPVLDPPMQPTAWVVLDQTGTATTILAVCTDQETADRFLREHREAIDEERELDAPVDEPYRASWHLLIDDQSIRWWSDDDGNRFCAVRVPKEVPPTKGRRR